MTRQLSAHLQMRQELIPEMPFSPESYFIKTGQIPADLNPARTKELGAKELSKLWYETARAKNGRAKLVLPTFRQRLYGGKLPKADLEEIETQVNFAVNAFAGNFPPSAREEIVKRTRKLIPGRMLSINATLREKTNGRDLKQMRQAGKELYHYLKERGEIYPALTQDHSGKIYFAKGWMKDRIARTAPIHEAIHILFKMGLIEADVPFAQAADRLYGLEHGLFKHDKRIRTPTAEEFDQKPGIVKEPGWAYVIGDRIGQWVFLNLPPAQRWKYLYLRSMGKLHREALLLMSKTTE